VKPGPFSPLRLVGACTPLLLWAVHLVTVYSVQGLACSGQMDGNVPADGSARLLLLLFSAAMLTLVAWQGVRGARIRKPPSAGRAPFLAMATMLAAVLAAIAIVFTTIPILMLLPCE
jgi:hypothetical protein